MEELDFGRRILLSCIWFYSNEYFKWHPTRPVIASIATSGDIHIWHTSSPDNWAAFAPGFEELEENIEYDEREDEFDIVCHSTPIIVRL